MANKKRRYRIRKKTGGEQAGVSNPMNQFMQKAAQGMQQPSPEEMAMMQQQQIMQQQASAQSQGNQVIPAIDQAMQQGVEPAQIVMKLLESGVPQNEIIQGFLEITLGQAQESGQELTQEDAQTIQAQVEQLVGTVIQQMQGAQQQRQPSEEEMMAMQQQQQMAQAPQMSKGGFKRKLLKSAKEDRELQTQTETPGSILPQPATLNTFIEGVKNEGNEFYAKEMSTAADSAGMFKHGGESKWWTDRKFARKASKQDPYERRDRRALRRGLEQGAFGRDDIDESLGTEESVLPENYSNRDFRDIYKDLGTMGADFASTFMPQVFSHRNTDNEFSRNGTGLEDTDVDIYFKRKPFGRREWSISGLDYTSLPAYGGRGNYNADGTYAPYGTRTQTTYSRGIEGVRTIANTINNANDGTDDPLIERDANISGPVDPIMNYQNDPEGMFSDPSNDPLRQFTDPANPALSEAAQAEAQARAEAEARAEEARLYEQQMLEKEAQGVIDNPSDGSGMSLLEQLDYLKSQGHKSADLTPTYTDEEMPEENEKTVEEYEAKQKEAARRAAEPLNKWKRENKDKLDYIYNSFHTATGSELANLAKGTYEEADSYANMIKWLRKHPDAKGLMEYQYVIEKYNNASAAEKAELEKKFKSAKELPAKNEARAKAKSDAARKKAYTVDAAKKYFTDKYPDYKKNPNYYKITKVGEGVYNLDGVDGGTFMRYEPRLDTYRTGGAVLPRYNGGGLLKSAASGVNKYLPGLVNYTKSLPLHRLNPFAQSTLGPDYAVGTANSALNFFRDGTNSGAVPTSIQAYNNKSGEGWVGSQEEPYLKGNRDIQYYDDAEKYIQENSPMYNTFTNADESNLLFQGIENANPQLINQKFPIAISIPPWNNKDVMRARNFGVPYPQSPADYRFKTFDNWKGWKDMKPEEVTKMMNTAQGKIPSSVTGDKISEYILNNAMANKKLNTSKNIMNFELNNLNNRQMLVNNLVNRGSSHSDDINSGYGTIMNNPMYRELKGMEGPMVGITNQGLSEPELNDFLRSQMLEGIHPQSTIAFDNNAALDNMRYVEALKSQGNPMGMINTKDEEGNLKPVLDSEEIQRLLFGNMSGRSKLGPHGDLKQDIDGILKNDQYNANNLWTNLNREGGAVHPDLYDYVYGGEDEMDPYFAPGGAFKEPKIDPALGVKRPSQEVQDYRENVYPTSKGIFGQVGDHLKSMVSPITQGQGIKGAFNTLGQAIAPTDFTWLSQNKYGKKNALGYIGVDGLPNTVVRPWDEDSLYYDNEAGYNTNNTGDRAVGNYTNLDYKKKPLRKGKLTVTDSPVKTDRDGNIVEDSKMGFLDMFKGTEIPLPGNKPKIAFGGETLNKYVMAGEIDENFMEDQEAPNLNLAENKEPDFDFSNCPEGWKTDPTTECYKKSMEMGTDENEYTENKARTINAPLIDIALDKSFNSVVDFSTAQNNANLFKQGFQEDAFSDMKAANTNYGINTGYDLAGEKSMVNAQHNAPTHIGGPRDTGLNTFGASRGGQYAVGGVYDLTSAQVGAIMAAGGTVEIIE